MSERSSPPPPGGDEDEVLQYLAAIESRRSAGSTFPEPERIADDLASAEMGEPADDPETLREQLAAHTPGTEAYIERLEDGFVAGAKEYGLRHGVRYEGWIQAGVDPSVLQRAGIEPDSD
jgi:hypothetical protein